MFSYLQKETIRKLCFDFYDHLSLGYDDDKVMIDDFIEEYFASSSEKDKIANLLHRFHHVYVDTDYFEEFENFEENLLSFADELYEDELKLAVVEQRGIESLYHFTRYDNLSSILMHGLVPVKTQRIRGIDSIRNDMKRIDRKQECTSLSVSFPNYKLFYRFRIENQSAKWVVIEIDPYLLASPFHNSYFYTSNAAATSTDTLEGSTKTLAFQQMFSNSYTKKSGHTLYRKMLDIPDSFTTNPQAEILTDGIIPLNYIKKMHFINSEDKLLYDKQFVQHSSNHNINSFVTPFLFDKRFDSFYWASR